MTKEVNTFVQRQVQLPYRPHWASARLTIHITVYIRHRYMQVLHMGQV
jgi:hypothetical protein